MGLKLLYFFSLLKVFDSTKEILIIKCIVSGSHFKAILNNYFVQIYRTIAIQGCHAKQKYLKSYPMKLMDKIDILRDNAKHLNIEVILSCSLSCVLYNCHSFIKS